MKTVYETIKEMLKDAEEIRDMAKAKGDEKRAAIWDAKVAQHKAELAKYA